MQQRDYTKYLNYILIGYAFSIPLSKAGVNIFETLAFLLWILEGKWKEKFLLLKENLLSISIILLFFVAIISLYHAQSIPYGLNYIGKYRHFLIILVVATSLKKEYIPRLLSAFLGGMFISEVMSYAIFFELIQYKDKSPNDPAPFMDHTDYSVYLSFTAILLINSFMHTKDNIKLKIFYLLFFITATTNLFINGGRSGQILFTIMIFTVLLLRIKNKLKALISSFILLSFIFLIAFQFSPVFQNRFNYLVKDIKEMAYENNYNNSFSTRVALWRVGIEKIKDNWIFGVGIGNDMNDVYKYAKKINLTQTNLNYGDNHNALITLTLMFGIFGFLIFILIFYSLFSLQYGELYYKVLGMSFSISFLLWSMTGNTFHGMQPMIYFTLFAGLFNRASILRL